MKRIVRIGGKRKSKPITEKEFFTKGAALRYNDYIFRELHKHTDPLEYDPLPFSKKKGLSLELLKEILS